MLLFFIIMNHHSSEMSEIFNAIFTLAILAANDDSGLVNDKTGGNTRSMLPVSTIIIS